MEFRTHARTDGVGLRIDWPPLVRNADIRRVIVTDRVGYDGTECFNDFELVIRDGYELTITLRPRETPEIHDIGGLRHRDLISRVRWFGEVRYGEAPMLLLNVDRLLEGLTSSEKCLPRGEWLDQRPVDRWTYLPTEGHFDFRIRASRSIDRSFFRPDVTTLDIVDHLLSDGGGLSYYEAIITADYEPRS